jgi:hypothetical protein
MENIRVNEDLFKYMDNYFKKNEEYFLRPNHRAPEFPELRDRLLGTDLKKRLEWAKNSFRKKRYADPVQTSLFETFDKEELANILRTFDIKDKVLLKESNFFKKIPMRTMQGLFLYNEALEGVTNEDKEMLAIEYAEYNRSSIVPFVISNETAILKSVAFYLLDQVKDEDQKKIANERYGEKMNFFESFILNVKGK